MEVATVDRRAKKILQHMIDTDEMPRMINLGRNFNPTFNNLRRLAHILVIATEVEQVVGEVSERSWWGVSRVLITVAECRQTPLVVNLRTVGFTITPRRQRRYTHCLRRAARTSMYTRWAVCPYTNMDKENACPL